MKEISLLRAAKIRNRIEKEIIRMHGMLMSGTVKLFNSYDPDVNDQLMSCAEEYEHSMSKFVALNNILVSIRTKIGDANVSCGLNEYLALRKTLVWRIEVLTHVSEQRDVMPTSDQLRARLKGNQEMLTGSGRYASTEISFSIISEHTLKGIKEELKNLRSKLDEIEEKIAKSNSITKIELDDIEISLLTSEGII